MIPEIIPSIFEGFKPRKSKDRRRISTKTTTKLQLTLRIRLGYTRIIIECFLSSSNLKKIPWNASCFKDSNLGSWRRLEMNLNQNHNIISLNPIRLNSNAFRIIKVRTHALPCILHCLLTIFTSEVHFYCRLSPWRKPLHRTSSISHPVKSRRQQKLLSFNKTSLFYWPDWRGSNEMKTLHGVASTLTRMPRIPNNRRATPLKGEQFRTVYSNINLSRTSRPPLCNRIEKKLLRDAFKCRACQLQTQFAFAQFLSIKIYFDSFEINLTSEREEHFTVEVSELLFKSPAANSFRVFPDKTRFNLTKLCSNCEILPQGPYFKV